MSEINNPLSFWRKTKVGEKSVKDNRLAYELPDKKDKNGNSVFEQIGIMIARLYPELMEQEGHLKLDKIWNDAPALPPLPDQGNEPDDEYAAIKAAYEERAKLHAVFLKLRTQLQETYPKPFCNRKMFLFKIPLESKDITTDKGIVKRKTLSGFKTTSNNKNYFKARFCIFNITDYGYTPNDETDAEEGYPYRYCGAFVSSDELMQKIGAEVKKIIDKDPQRNQVYVLFLTPNVSVKKQTAKPKADAKTTPSDVPDLEAKPEEKETISWNYTVDIDDAFFF